MAETETIPVEFGGGKMVDIPRSLYQSGDREAILSYARSPQANVYDKVAPRGQPSQSGAEAVSDLAGMTLPGDPLPVRTSSRSTTGTPSPANYAMEAVTSTTRPFAQMLDIATAVPQYLAAAAEERTFAPQRPLYFSSGVAPRGYYAGDTGITRMIAGAGELATMALPAGIYTRALSNLVAQNTNIAPTAFQRMMAELGKVGPKQDVGFGLMAGFGGEALVEAGQTFDFGNEDINRLAGQVLSPAAFSAVANTVVNQGRALLAQAAPTTAQLRGLKNTLYSLIDESGARLDGPSLNSINEVLTSFEEQYLRDRSGFSNVRGIVENLRKLSDESALTYTSLQDAVSDLRTIAGNRDDTAARYAGRLATNIDDLYKTFKPLKPEVLGGREFQRVVDSAREVNRRMSNSITLSNILEEMRLDSTLLGKGTKDLFRQIANRIRKSHAPGSTKEGNFTKAELDMIEEMAQGTSVQKAFEFMGKFAINSQDFLTTMLLSTGVSVGVAAAAGGATPMGAMIGAGTFVGANIIGNFGRAIANKLAANNAGLMRDLINAGPNAKNILEAYVKNVPRDKRDPTELATLFYQNARASDILDLPSAEASQLVGDAVAIAIAMDQVVSAGQREIEQEMGREAGAADVPRVPVGF